MRTRRPCPRTEAPPLHGRSQERRKAVPQPAARISAGLAARRIRTPRRRLTGEAVPPGRSADPAETRARPRCAPSRRRTRAHKSARLCARTTTPRVRRAPPPPTRFRMTHRLRCAGSANSGAHRDSRRALGTPARAGRSRTQLYGRRPQDRSTVSRRETPLLLGAGAAVLVGRRARGCRPRSWIGRSALMWEFVTSGGHG
jgi:hypothetical protein